MFLHSIFGKTLSLGINPSFNVSLNSTVKPSYLGLSRLEVLIPDSASVLITALFRVSISFCFSLGRLHISRNLLMYSALSRLFHVHLSMVVAYDPLCSWVLRWNMSSFTSEFEFSPFGYGL